MQRASLKSLLLALTTVAALGTTTPAMSQSESKSNQAGKSAAGTGMGSSEMHQSMMSGMQEMQSMKPTGNVDKDFAMMMRMHHQQAIQMAKTELARGKSPELKAMAQKIVQDQAKEIAELDAWLAKNK